MLPIEPRSADDLGSVGHHFLIGLQPSPRITDHDKRLLATLRPAGVVLFRDNFEHGTPYDRWLETLGELLREVREAIGRREILVGLDHEGGRVHRPPPPITHWPPAGRWGERAGTIALAMGRELRSLGVNLDFAPVADVARRGTDPVIGDRAFGTTVEEVCSAVRAVVRALHDEGVWACPKHYPGHGDATADSHLELPRLEASLDELRAGPLLPFAAAIEAGARCLMSAHLAFPRIDARPSTMSDVLLRRVLREELGYGGLLITDDLGMHAVSRGFDEESAVAATLAATTDLLMVCAHWTDTRRAALMAGHVLSAVRRGELAEGDLQASAARIRRALETVPQHEPAPLAPAHLERHQELAGEGFRVAADPTAPSAAR